ncbi:site-specific integrase [Vibrio metschnikovii]|nr:site-specific integrase [Vibrio metschnikovii]EKO3601164.1 site-specific integrase [Vibrio metschnikovii]EKO3612174.1 site-specific integrase [Vibrio metschnikovii]EKO3632873.1 site-specific integrase [Vibrio metschnikovii]EKO3678126.1 site-specific integrase [Vibrio metschnikovii]
MAKGHFAKSEKQAASVMKEMQGKGNVIESVGTARNYEQSLKTCCDYLKEFKLGSLREMTPEKANTYLELRAQECSQKTIDMDRQALQAMMQHVTHELKETDKLDVIKSSVETVESSRSYTPEQVNAIIQHETEHHALSTQLCYESGLRAHELHTLRPSGEVNPSPRDVHQDKFSHLPNDSKTYTVEGKGGLIREVQIPNHLAEKLEERRLDTPQQISDRGVNYESHYNIAGGHKFSDAFSKASSRALGFSNGAHGLRHSYAQNRYEQLANHFERIDVMTIISQELGHFRPDITEIYLR